MRVRDPQGDIPFVDLGLFSVGGKDQGEAAPGRKLNRMDRVAGLLHGEYSPFGAILTVLRELDPVGAHHYADELLMVAKELTMVEGQWIVDHTRIHVDLAALRRWADRELTEDFERHQDLVGVDAGPQASFEDVLKELAAGPSGRKIQPPETEADAVLQSLVRRLGDEFLTNSQFGLDFYLSKRIRHQSFIGRIRGPLEFANLITTRETEASPYHRNDFWIDPVSYTHLTLPTICSV